MQVLPGSNYFTEQRLSEYGSDYLLSEVSVWKTYQGKSLVLKFSRNSA